jgi:hypothetical protein
MFEQASPILGGARGKIRRSQWRELKLIVGGGGAKTLLYPNAVNQWCQQFCDFQPESRPIPLPGDLKWPAAIPEAHHTRVFRRFSVAYGLSCGQNLADHRLPVEVGPLPQPAPAGEAPAGRCRRCQRPSVAGEDYCSEHI